MNHKVLILILITFAFLIRIYNIKNTTVFLGDQGRDGVAIWELLKQKKLPVVGPTVGAGHYTGPLYYYLIAPSFIVGNGNPIAPVIEMSMISVAAIVLFLHIAIPLSGFPIAYGMSLLWALSPHMIIRDRVLWNPTPIPFFILLLIASLIWMSRDKKYWACLTATFAALALIQLHYVNGISLVIAGCWFVVVVYQWIQKKTIKHAIPWLIASLALSVILLYPFIAYEREHGFQDITGSYMTISYTGGQVFSKRVYLSTFLDICARLGSYVVAFPWKLPLIVLAVCITLAGSIRKAPISYLLVAWSGIGVAVLSLYRDTFQPHYAYQFIPIVYLLTTLALQGLRKIATWFFILVSVVGITIGSWFFTNPYHIQDPDIPRVAALTDAALSIVGTDPFSFTVMHSRSFTDFHVRYFFLMKNAHLVSVDDTNTKILLLICEGNCPNAELIRKEQVMCHADRCPLDKPFIDFSRWRYVSTSPVGTAAIYTYKR